MRTVRHTILLLLLTSGFLTAQEISYIDLTFVAQRTDLRHPPAPPPVCKDGTCTGGGIGGGGIGCGAPDVRDPHALAVQLLRLTPTDIDPAVPFEAEFRFLNSGRAPIELPVSPHLSDLQPPDESLTFSYFSLSLIVRVQRDSQEPSVSPVGCSTSDIVNLYPNATPTPPIAGTLKTRRLSHEL